ncbi:MAG: hypothetical protein AAF368_20095 [Planctomycetota bacterium]
MKNDRDETEAEKKLRVPPDADPSRAEDSEDEITRKPVESPSLPLFKITPVDPKNSFDFEDVADK